MLGVGIIVIPAAASENSTTGKGVKRLQAGSREQREATRFLAASA